ncbi:MAG: hypothetical protein GEV28_09600 [Actinophytocola sp.]|uniref:NucA/NucB deoxyribonuclease domain-containing protein n=1 Tax=Actinophytocola sp. TaxID=1872138 RepID=UPI001326E2D1|nr:NucA/NucB deoxyribonuclease domain-containing protein [Actinophytocola sp.]MPZ80624.1 hypothetical protein [Actinophytocola sp.]
MATKTTGRLLVTALVIGAGVYFTPKAVDAVGSIISDLTGATDAVIVGEAPATLMIAAETQPQVTVCATQTIVNEKRCGDMRVLIVDASRIPFIARNTKLAWESGHPAVLTMNRAKQDANRGKACQNFRRTYGGQCDEYPMASTDEGGAGARAEEVPARENQCQGGLYVSQYPPNGERFLVVISNPDHVAPGPFTGTEVARDQGTC